MLLLCLDTPLICEKTNYIWPFPTSNDFLLNLDCGHLWVWYIYIFWSNLTLKTLCRVVTFIKLRTQGWWVLSVTLDRTLAIYTMQSKTTFFSKLKVKNGFACRLFVIIPRTREASINLNNKKTTNLNLWLS